MRSLVVEKSHVYDFPEANSGDELDAMHLQRRRFAKRATTFGLVVAGVVAIVGSICVVSSHMHKAHGQREEIVQMQEAKTSYWKHVDASPEQADEEAKHVDASREQADEEATAGGVNSTSTAITTATATPTTTATATSTTLVPLEGSVAVVNRMSSTTMYCFVVVIKDTNEPWLVRAQLVRDTGVFGCNHYTFFSDKPLWLDAGPGRPLEEAVAIPGQEAWQGPVPGSSEPVWHNTVVFLRAWKWIQERQIYQDYSWTVKVDADTVFLPGILQRHLSRHSDKGFDGTYMEILDPETPEYLVNCKQWYSFQGPLEVLSRAAAAKFFGGLDSCESGLPWKAWGEDWFVGSCLDHVGVQRREGFELLDDMYCVTPLEGGPLTYLQQYEKNGPTCVDGKAAYHPYKTTDEFVRCLGQSAGLNRDRVQEDESEDHFVLKQ